LKKQGDDLKSNKMRKIFTILVLWGMALLSQAQPFQVSGFVKDATSGDQLPSAHIIIDGTEKILISNQYGFFSFKSSTQDVSFQVYFTGYVPTRYTLKPTSDTVVFCLLETNDYTLGQVNVIADMAVQTLFGEVGSTKLTGRELERIPTILGERDLVKALQLIPGIKMGKEGTSGMYVRGGSPGQNLILLDEVPVYNVNHLFGFFSVFSPEAIKSVEIYKGAFPARFGGRTSSVMDIKMKEGNLNKSCYDLTIGTLSSKFTAEIPLLKEKASLLISGRRTYLDLFLQPFMKTTSFDKRTTTKNGYNFYDLNAKLFWDMGKNSKIFWSYYMGRDSYNSQTKTNKKYKNTSFNKYNTYEDYESNYNWGNYTTSVRWNKLIGNNVFLNTTILYSHYSYQLQHNKTAYDIVLDSLETSFDYKNLSSVTDYGFYVDFDHFASNTHQLNYGVRSTWHQFKPSHVSISKSTSPNNGGNYFIELGTFVEALEINTYFEDKISLGKRFKLVAGLHHSLYATSDTLFSILQPRIRAMANFESWALKFSAGRMAQPVHNLVNNSNGMSVDIWVPTGKKVLPSTSFQVDLGADWHFAEGCLLSLSGYYRITENILSYRAGESFFNLFQKWDEKVTSGNGQSYGIEVFARKTMGHTTGWAGYTWSVSTQNFELLNNGKPFPSPYDRPHYFTLSLNHRFSEKVTLSGNWVFASGEPITASSTAYFGDESFGTAPRVFNFGFFEKQISSPNEIVYYPSINNYRLPNYHRLDVAIDLYKKKKKGTRIWSFSIYNLYGRNNPFLVSIEEDKGKLALKNVSLFRFLPSVSYRYTF
jgi:outer membrane receptor for ferrienterochelin and colicin